MNLSEKMAVMLRMLREIHNYKQDYVASVLNITPNTYCLLEKGQATLSIERIEKLALLYKIDLVDFIHLNEETIAHLITSSKGISNDKVKVHNTILTEEERKLYKSTIKRLEEQNDKLMKLLEKLSDKS